MGYSSIDAACEVLALRRPELADDARHAAHWIAGGDDVDETDAITLAGVQRFLWHGLPLKWMMPDENKPAVVAALAVFCELIERPLLVEVCRSATTARVLAAFARSDDEGWRAFGAAMKTSLVTAVEVERFSWGSVMGLEEARAMSLVEAELERALVDGRVVKGRNGWKVAQRAVVDEVLDRPHWDQPGQSVLTAIVTERLANWTDASRRSPTLGRWRAAVANRLLHPIPVPADADEILRVLLWFCDEVCSHAVPLTQKGLLSQAFVRRVAVEQGWWDLRGQPRTETDVWQLHELHQFVRSAGFARHERGGLVATLAGIESRSKLAGTWSRIVEHLAGRGEFDVAAFEACALQLVAADEPIERGELLSGAAVVLGEAGWHTSGASGPTPPTSMNVGHGIRSGLNRLVLFGGIHGGDDWRRSTIALTDSGRQLVLAWLRTIATGPRRGFG